MSGPENIISMFTKRKMVVLKTKIFLYREFQKANTCNYLLDKTWQSIYSPFIQVSVERKVEYDHE